MIKQLQDEEVLKTSCQDIGEIITQDHADIGDDSSDNSISYDMGSNVVLSQLRTRQCVFPVRAARRDGGVRMG